MLRLLDRGLGGCVGEGRKCEARTEDQFQFKASECLSILCFLTSPVWPQPKTQSPLLRVCLLCIALLPHMTTSRIPFRRLACQHDEGVDVAWTEPMKGEQGKVYRRGKPREDEDPPKAASEVSHVRTPQGK